MNTLEEYLIKEGILEKFLRNVDNVESRKVTLNNAFIWEDTPEGIAFWEGFTRGNYIYITQDRITELIIERIPRFRGEVL